MAEPQPTDEWAAFSPKQAGDATADPWASFNPQPAPAQDEKSVPDSFLHRVAMGLSFDKAATAGIQSAKEGFGTEKPGMSDEFAKDARSLGIFYDPAGAKVQNRWKLFAEAAARTTALAGDLTMRSMNSALYGIGGVVGEITGDPRAREEAINLGNFLMIEGGQGSFSRAHPVAASPLPEVIGDLPKDADFKTSAAAMAGPSSTPLQQWTYEQNLRDLWNERGIHPAEAYHDSAADALLKRQLATPPVNPTDRSGIVPPTNSPVSEGTPRSMLAQTGEAHIDAVLSDPATKAAIDNPVINRSNDVPYSAGPDVAGNGLNIDRHFPTSFTIEGVTFDPADPFAVHEFVERDVMEKLIAGGMGREEAYKIAHFEYAEKAEGAWYKAHGIDQAKAEAAYQPYIDQIQHENPANPPPNLFRKPYPHDDVTLAAKEPIAEPKPTPEELTAATKMVEEHETAAESVGAGREQTAERVAAEGDQYAEDQPARLKAEFEAAAKAAGFEIRFAEPSGQGVEMAGRPGEVVGGGGGPEPVPAGIPGGAELGEVQAGGAHAGAEGAALPGAAGRPGGPAEATTRVVSPSGLTAALPRVARTMIDDAEAYKAAAKKRREATGGAGGGKVYTSTEAMDRARGVTSAETKQRYADAGKALDTMMTEREIAADDVPESVRAEAVEAITKGFDPHEALELAMNKDEREAMRDIDLHSIIAAEDLDGLDEAEKYATAEHEYDLHAEIPFGEGEGAAAIGRETAEQAGQVSPVGGAAREAGEGTRGQTGLRPFADFHDKFVRDTARLPENDERIVRIATNIGSMISELGRKFPKLSKELRSVKDYIEAANDNGLAVENAVERLTDTLDFVEKNGGPSDLTSRLGQMVDDLTDLIDEPFLAISRHESEITQLYSAYRDFFDQLINPKHGTVGAAMSREEMTNAVRLRLEKLNRTVATKEAEGKNGLGDKILKAEQMAYEDAAKVLERPPPVEPGAEGRPQFVMPGMEQSARQAAAAREAGGALKPGVAQEEPGGLFAARGDEAQHDLLVAQAKGIMDRALAEGAGEPEGVAHALGAEATGPLPSLAQQPPPPPGRLVTAAQSALTKLFDIGRDIQMKIAPMAMGAKDAMRLAKNFANAMRRNQMEWGRIDEYIKNTFDAEQRKRMWDAADEESVLRQEGRTSEHMGLATLTPEERGAVEMLQSRAQLAWLKARDLQMVEGEGLPSYTPRMIINAAEAVKGDGAIPLNGLGANLRVRTAQMMRRKYLTAEETEAAAKAKLGEDAEIARDIRSLPLATAKLEDAIAGRTFVDSIKEVGKRAGSDTVAEGFEPRDSDHQWFTIDNPALKTWRPKFAIDEETGKTVAVKDVNGNMVFEQVPIYIRGDFEGPLRAVLSERKGAQGFSGGLYAFLMAAKAKTMSLVMYSPIIHNAVEYGRAFPAMPGKVVFGKVYFEGNRAKNNPAIMSEAVDHGLVPIGHRFFNQDITSIMEEPNLTPGRSLTAKVLGFVPGLFDPAAETAVRAAIDKAGDVWHNTLLWDRVGDLQMGLYVNFRDEMVAKGVDRETASYAAAHWANRYAGSLPQEAMSAGARATANLLLFSRTFTLGNIGVMKDAFGHLGPAAWNPMMNLIGRQDLRMGVTGGLPRDVMAQIEHEAGALHPEVVGMARQIAIRKAAAIVAMDIGLYYIGNSLLQSALNIIRGDDTVEGELRGYADRMSEATKKRVEHPMSLLQPFDFMQSLSSTSENEPGAEDRVKVGYTSDGTAIYARNPFGKIGAEFTGWITSPLDMIRRKESTMARPVWNIFSNDKGFGRKVYDPNADTPLKDAKNIGAIAWELVRSSFPEQAINATSDILTGQGDARVNAAQALGPLGGITFSRGAPGGPAVGELYRARQEHDFAVQQELPAIRRQIQSGDIYGAMERMNELGIPGGLQKFYIGTTLDPSTRLSGRTLRDFYLYATPEQRARMERAQERNQ